MVCIGRVLVLVALTTVALDWTAELYAIDICLDAGDVYDYATSTCRADAERLPYLPYVQRSAGLLIVASFVALLGTAFLFIGRNKRG